MAPLEGAIFLHISRNLLIQIASTSYKRKIKLYEKISFNSNVQFQPYGM